MNGGCPRPGQSSQNGPTGRLHPMTSRPQPNNPLHGITLEVMVSELVAHFGWQELGRRIPIRCFTHDPSLGSSLKFLRRTPWAKQKVEALYLVMRDAR